MLRFSFPRLTKKTLIMLAPAALVGLLYSLYHLIGAAEVHKLGEIYQPVTPQSDAGNFIIFYQRIREYIDGYKLIGDINTFEFREMLSNRPPLPAILYYVIYLFAGMKGMVVVADFLFPAIIFVALFHFFKLILNRFWPSLAAAFILIVSNTSLPFLVFFRSMSQFKELVKMFLPLINNNQIPAMRFILVESIKPSLVIVTFFYATLFIFFKSVSPKKSRVIGLGILYGLTFYTYPFYWMYATILMGLFGLFYLWRKNWEKFKKLLLSGSIGLLISSYFWLMYVKFLNLPQHNDIFDRSANPDIGHFFRFSQWWWYLIFALLLGLLFIWSKRKSQQPVFTFLTIMILGGVIGLNSQVILGVAPEPDHWYAKILFLPLFLVEFILIIWAIDSLKEHFNSKRKIVAGCLIFFIAFVMLNAVLSEIAIARREAKLHIVPKPILESMEWINNNVAKDSVIASPSLYIQTLVPYFTSARVLVPMSWNTTAAEEEIRERLFIDYKLYGVLPEKFAQIFKSEAADVTWYNDGRGIIATPNPINYIYGFGNRRINSARFQDSLDSHFIPNPFFAGRVREDLLAQYNQFTSSTSNLLKKYRLDYLYVGQFERLIGTENFDKLSYLHKVYDQNDVQIYKVINNQ